MAMIASVLAGQSSAEEGAAEEAGAELQLGAASGLVQPFEGTIGWTVMGQILLQLPEKWRFGVEFQYRDFEAEFLNVSDVSVQMFQLQGVWHRRFLPPAAVVPYYGGGLGLSVNVIDSDRIERRRPSLNVDDVGVGVGIVGLLGLDVRVGRSVLLFGEARITGDLQTTDKDGDESVQEIGGVQLLTGVRF